MAIGGGAFGSEAALGCDSWWRRLCYSWQRGGAEVVRLLAALLPSVALVLEGAMLAMVVCSDKMFQEETNFNLPEALEEFQTT